MQPAFVVCLALGFALMTSGARLASAAPGDPIVPVISYCEPREDLGCMSAGYKGPGFYNSVEDRKLSVRLAYHLTDPTDDIQDAIDATDQIDLVNDDGVLNEGDVARLRNAMADPVGAALPAESVDRCSVIGGAADCDLLDLVVIGREVANRLPPRLAPVCAAAEGRAGR